MAATKAVSARARASRFGLLAFGLLALGLAASGGIAVPAAAQTIGLSPQEALHQALRLTARQEVAWQVYRQATPAPDAAKARRNAASQLFPTLDAPHRMDLVEAEMRQELRDLQGQSLALKAFYAALSPEQQRIFDARSLPQQAAQPATQ